MGCARTAERAQPTYQRSPGVLRKGRQKRSQEPLRLVGECLWAVGARRSGPRNVTVYQTVYEKKSGLAVRSAGLTVWNWPSAAVQGYCELETMAKSDATQIVTVKALEMAASKRYA